MKVTQYTTTASSQYLTDDAIYMRKTEVFSTNVRTNGSLLIKVSNTPNKERFCGFGVALTGSACHVLSLMEEEKRDTFLKDIYTKEGLDLSVGRLTIGSCDYSPEIYSYDDVENDTELKHFSVERDKKYIIPMIKEVLKKKKDLALFASPWSPPGWMKTGGSMCGGYMREKYIECYARYFVKFLEAYEKEGIDIFAVTAQNEPETDQGGRYPACKWHPEDEAKFILKLRKKLEEAGKDTQIWMHDHNFEAWYKIVWILKEYPELMQACGSVAFHYYDTCIETTDIIKKEFPNINFHFTEGGPRLFDNYATDWCKWGIMMAKALNRGFITFTGWNLLLDETGGPNIGPFFCGGLATYNMQTKELSYSGQYRALRHFGGFIKKNAKIYPAKAEVQGLAIGAFPSNYIDIEICAAENEDGSFVLQIVNANEYKAQLNFEHDKKLYYIESLPNSISTVIFEN